MPKSDEAVLKTLINNEDIIFAFMGLDALCFLIIFIILCILMFKLLFRNGKENFDNIVINWDFNDEPIESKLPKKFSFACVVSLVAYLIIYGLEFLYFLQFTEINDLPSDLTSSTKDGVNAIEDWLQDKGSNFGKSVAMLDLLTYIIFIITKFLLFVIFIGMFFILFTITNTIYIYIYINRKNMAFI